MVCRLVKYFPKQVQSENTKPGKWHKIVINFPVNCWKKLKKKVICENRKKLQFNCVLQWIMISANLKMILQLKVVCSPERIFPYLSKMSSLLLLWIHPHNLSFKFVSNLSDLRCHILCANLNVTPGLSFEFLDPTNLKIPYIG